MPANIHLLDLSDPIFSVHPKAKPAYRFYHQIAPAMPGVFDKAFSLREKIPMGQIIQAIQVENRIKIFTGFEHTFFDLEILADTQPTVLIHAALADDAIETMAWQATLRALCSAKDEKWIRANFYAFAQGNLPADICLDYFGKRKLTKNILARLLDIKINTLIDGIQRHRQRNRHD